MKRRAPFVLAALVALLGCYPTIRVEAHFRLPPGADPSRLHVRGRAICRLSSDETKRPEPPPPGPPEPRDEAYAQLPDGGVEYRPVEIEKMEFRMEGDGAHAQLRGAHCWIAMTGFYDADGDGKVGPGDLVGTLPAREVVDRGLCLGNDNLIGYVDLVKR